MKTHPQVGTVKTAARSVCLSILVLLGVNSRPALGLDEQYGVPSRLPLSEPFEVAPPFSTPLPPHDRISDWQQPAARGPDVQPATFLEANYLAEPTPAEPGVELNALDELREEIKKLKAATARKSDYGKGMTLVLDNEGHKYIRFISWLQAWTTFTDNNPGTVDAYGELKDSALDIGIRRARFLAYSQLTERYLVLLHMGINNQTFTNGGDSGSVGIGANGVGKKPQLFLHDAWNEYAVVLPSEGSDFSLATGAGLHFWNGVSRKASAGTFTFMTVDAMIFNWPNIEFTDQFARQLGWYAKGKLSKLDYRVSINQPFNADGRAGLNTERAVNIPSSGLAFAGYFEWEFWDQESNLLPYKVSTWLGEKSVFNIGAGFYTFPDSSGIKDTVNPLLIHKQGQTVVGIDAYLDTPVGDCGAALTIYCVDYMFDYGTNYYRDVGIMNTGILGSPTVLAAQGITPTISGAGNAQPLLGTGNIFYAEAGYVLPSWVLGGIHGKLQPFGAFTCKNLDWLKDVACNYDMGFNYLIDGHHAKLTCQYSLRPQFIQQTVGTEVQRVADGSAGELIIQAQIAL